MPRFLHLLLFEDFVISACECFLQHFYPNTHGTQQKKFLQTESKILCVSFRPKKNFLHGSFLLNKREKSEDVITESVGFQLKNLTIRDSSENGVTCSGLICWRGFIRNIFLHPKNAGNSSFLVKKWISYTNFVFKAVLATSAGQFGASPPKTFSPLSSFCWNFCGKEQVFRKSLKPELVFSKILLCVPKTTRLHDQRNPATSLKYLEKELRNSALQGKRRKTFGELKEQVLKTSNRYYMKLMLIRYHIIVTDCYQVFLGTNRTIPKCIFSFGRVSQKRNGY